MKPMNNLVNPMLTDKYQATMLYGYWSSDKHQKYSVFDLHCRKNPFGGEFMIFAGREEILDYLDNFSFRSKDIGYLKKEMPNCENAFFEWLRELDCSRLQIYAPPEGTIMFPRVPLLRVEGDLGIAQFVETALLNMVNFPSLMVTNAARFRLAAGWDKKLLEFGLRRAQGPDGAVTASRYSYMGGFDSTSNVLAGQLYGIPISGTHAHSFVQSFTDIEEVKHFCLRHKTEGRLLVNFWNGVKDVKKKLGLENTNEDELAAFIAYACAFPDGFLALVDTYGTLLSGIPNFIIVAHALKRLDYQPLGIRLDSGDLAYLSKEARKILRQYDLGNVMIVASNDIDEETLYSLKEQGNEIDAFGIGTHLVTCKNQPALGCVYKLTEIENSPRIKLSNDPAKITLPGRKDAFRLYGREGYPILDLLMKCGEEAPKCGEKILCRHPFIETKRVLVRPNAVKPLYEKIWDGGRVVTEPSIHEKREYVIWQLRSMREDHIRSLNPTPYKVSISQNLYGFLHTLMATEAPIKEIS